MEKPVTEPAQPCLAGQIQHPHDYGQGIRTGAERRTLIVTCLTIVTMIAEIFGGWLTGSMALLADGIHMGGHSVALGLAAGAYYLTRRHAGNRRLSLGSGKIGDLAAFASALLLAVSVVWLIQESIQRLLQPTTLHPREALLVAGIGLLVNLLSAWLLAGSHSHSAGPDGAAHDRHHHHQDNNLRAALVHVIADAVTSLAAIAGLIAAWVWGWNWLDPTIALVASLVILRWATGLLRQTGAVLLDAEGPAGLRTEVRQRLEAVAHSEVIDLHLWSVGQGAWTLVAAVVSHGPVAPADYKRQLADLPEIHHPVIEIHPCCYCDLPPRQD
ncbi:MAG: CDF family Co(II)/Ni(II) efflux transporter DmeF [Pelovirga sp.]